MWNQSELPPRAAGFDISAVAGAMDAGALRHNRVSTVGRRLTSANAVTLGVGDGETVGGVAAGATPPEKSSDQGDGSIAIGRSYFGPVQIENVSSV